MPNYPQPRLSNITKRRSSTLASQGAASTIINSTSSPTNNNHASSRSLNRADSPTYSNIVQNLTTTISPFASITTKDLSDDATPNPTNNTVLQLPITKTSSPIDNNNNKTAVDDTHNNNALLPTKPAYVPKFTANYYHDLFEDTDYDDLDDDDTDDDRLLTQFDLVPPSTQIHQHSTKSHSPTYKDSHNTTTTTIQPINKSNLDKSANHISNDTRHPSTYHPPSTVDDGVPHNKPIFNRNNDNNLHFNVSQQQQ